MRAELVVADLTNGAEVVRALRGCRRMYFGMSISSSFLQATAIAAAAAKEIPDFEIPGTLLRDVLDGLSECHQEISLILDVLSPCRILIVSTNVR